MNVLMRECNTGVIYEDGWDGTVRNGAENYSDTPCEYMCLISTAGMDIATPFSNPFLSVTRFFVILNLIKV